MPTPHPSTPATGLGTPARWSSQAPPLSGEPRRLSRLPDSSFSLPHRYPVFLTKDAPAVSLQSIANSSNICPGAPVLHHVEESVCYTQRRMRRTQLARAHEAPVGAGVGILLCHIPYV